MNIVVVIGVLVTLVTCIPVFMQMRKHPRGLHILFFAEMWERFSFYGMRALLIFYLTQHFLFDDAFSNSQYGAYASLVYLLPLIGGFLADKYLGNRKAIAFGALLLVGGHMLMAVEGEPAKQVLVTGTERIVFDVEGRGDTRRVFLPVGAGVCELNPREATEGCSVTADANAAFVFTNLPRDAQVPAVLPASDYTLEVEGRSQLIINIFYLALALIIMGVGFLKANISSIVGQLYEQGDPRRDPGFTLYYYGINLGAFWASVLCGLLGETYGWGYGFGLAGVGMLFGYLVFARRRLLFFTPGPVQLPDHVGAPPEPERLAAKVFGPLSQEHVIYLGGLMGVGIVWLLVQSPPAVILANLNAFVSGPLGFLGLPESAHVQVGLMLFAGTVAVMVYLIAFMLRECTWVESQRMILALILVATSAVFWAFFEQAGSSLNLFASRNTALPNDGFFTVTASQTQSFNAGFILIFAPVFSALWVFLGRRNLDPNPSLKFGLALIQLGIGFFVLVWGAQFANEAYRVPMIFLVLLYLFHTTGELFLSPVGLSMITKLSVARVVSTMMAVWFVASAFAHYAGGIIATLAGTQTVAGAALDPELALATSVQVFQGLGVVAVSMGAILAVASFGLKRLAHEGKDRHGVALTDQGAAQGEERPRPAE